MILFTMGHIFPKTPNMKGKNGSNEDFRIVSFETTIRIKTHSGSPVTPLKSEEPEILRNVPGMDIRSISIYLIQPLNSTPSPYP